MDSTEPVKNGHADSGISGHDQFGMTGHIGGIGGHDGVEYALSSGYAYQEIAMLSIEYVHKRVRLFRIELSLVAVALSASFILLWQLLLLLRIIT